MTDKSSKQKLKRYSIEDIYCKLEKLAIKKGKRILGDENISVILAEAMSFLPKNLVDRVIKDVYFLPHNPYFQRGFCMSAEHLLEEMLGKKAIIYFTFDDNEKTIIKTILHEIAHYVLNHKGGFPTGDPAEEKEANELADKWLKEK